MEGSQSRSAGLTEAIILAGGKGSRLRSVVQDLPKPMAPVGGKPFLSYQISWLARQGIRRAILSVGYLHNPIAEFFGTGHYGVELRYAIEEEPLGTGGGVMLAIEQVQEPDVLLVNGDTFFAVDIAALWRMHVFKEADATLALRRLDDTRRYGRVEIDPEGRISKFSERGSGGPGLVNSGVSVLSVAALRRHAPSGSFSLEKDFFEKESTQLCMIGVTFDGFFIDIGTPEDYDRAQKLLPAQV